MSIMDTVSFQTAMAAVAKHLSDDNPEAAQLASHLLHRVPEEEADSRAPFEWAAIARSIVAFGHQRKAGEVLLRMFNPQTEQEGWSSDYTIIELINDDMPFLVDSVSLALYELGVQFELILHPTVRVKRDDKGVLQEVYPVEEHEAGAGESWMQISIERKRNPERLTRLKEQILCGLEDTRLAVQDWKEMMEKCTGYAQSIQQKNVPYPEDIREETSQFLEWLADDHFTFLGYREYEIREDKDGTFLEALEPSGLGILRKPSTNSMRRVMPLSKWGPEGDLAPEPLFVTSSNARATVHRLGYMDYIGILRFDNKGQLIGESRFVGLFTSSAYNRRPWNIPLLRQRVQAVISRSGLRPSGHGGKALYHILETLPREELLQSNADEMYRLAMGILQLAERKKIRLFARNERFGRFISCFVFLPREKFNTERRLKVQRILKRAMNGEDVSFNVQIDESVLARLHVVVRPKNGEIPQYDIEDIEARITQALRSWDEELLQVLRQRFGLEKGDAWFAAVSGAFPSAYTEDISPWVASFDVENLHKLQSSDDLRLSLYKPRKRHVGLYRFKIFRAGNTIPLSDVLPMLENMGAKVVSERPYRLKLKQQEKRWIQDFDIVFPNEGELNLEQVRAPFQEAFARAVNGETESDGFNRLVLMANLNWRQVVILRAYSKYLQQAGSPFSQQYVEQALERYPVATRLLIALFEIRFDPDMEQGFDAYIKSLQKSVHVLDPETDLVDGLSGKNRCDLAEQVRGRIIHRLERVASLDDDRILRAFLDLISATWRTNHYRRLGDDQWPQSLSLKINAQEVSFLPKPRPVREVFVYSPRVEGVHLRMGSVARGGLRWSDRREDFRTEVLGLMKAQNVKNTMIVPVGAKGGFYVKKPPEEGSREDIQAEGVACYKLFINALLDISDNLGEEGDVIHPDNVVRHDGDDPYLVVAADKGTATFSDIANEQAINREFWLGDAFASGGSVGYDHKGMGITAKGAWESVKRHFRELGVDCQSQPFSVVGIGDMMGDVFGNGMLLSRHIRLKAAFNHMHIFLDPDPDTEASYQERERMFKLPRSSWADYNSKCISKGGGIFERSAKTIPLSAPVRKWLGVSEEEMAPSELIHRILQAPVDLLWNGGIGTYIKSSAETDAEVGDRSNDALRVNGKELQCKVFGEGGNLGATQLGRIEFALHGGRVNTDFVDNSAGVDCSDHEVNIKILLRDATRGGYLSEEQRVKLLEQMTDEVSSLVLRNNYLQTQALTMMEYLSYDRLGAKGHFISVLEQQGLLDRELEFLPDSEELERRSKANLGLTRPELAVMLSYSKIALYQELIQSDVPEDPFLGKELAAYFPQPLQEKFPELMQQHRLKREIIATVVTNAVVNRMGATFALRMHEDTGATSASIAKAFTAACEIFAVTDLWRAIESLDNVVSADCQLKAHLVIWRLLRQVTRWLLVHRHDNLDIAQLVDTFKDGIAALQKQLPDSADKATVRQIEEEYTNLESAGLPEKLARQLAVLPCMNASLDIVELAQGCDVAVSQAADVHAAIGAQLKLIWLSRSIEQLAVAGRWHAHARGSLRDQLLAAYRQLGRLALNAGVRNKTEVAEWIAQLEHEADHVRPMLKDMRDSYDMDYATISVALRGLEQLIGAAQKDA